MITSRVYLCGFMGSGKTTVGRLLAGRLNYGFSDTDEEIRRSEGKSVAEIFETLGETYFREREREVLQILARQTSLVVALGGGSLMDDENRQLVKRTGVLIHLRVSLTVVATRLRHVADRPLLRKTPPLEELFEARRAGYQSADWTVDTDDRTPVSVANLILTSGFFAL